VTYPDFVRMAPTEIVHAVACRICGSLLPDAGSIQMAHLDWHKDRLLANDPIQNLIRAASAWRKTIGFGGSVPNRLPPGRHQEDFDLAHAIDRLKETM
jgi:hypothetical protein